MKKFAAMTATAAALVLAGCESATPAQRNAAIGAGLGAAAGAAISDDDTEGALIGGAIGAAVGYYTGCREQGGCFVGGDRVSDRRYYDQRADRYYFRDPATGNTYWENGEIRSYG